MTQRPPMKKINKFGTPSTTSNTTKQQPSTTATISCAFSNGNVQVYDQSTLLPIESYRPQQPQCTNHVNSHHFLSTDMKYGPTTSPCTLFTTGNDGSFVTKDLRQPSHVMAQSIHISTLR